MQILLFSEDQELRDEVAASAESIGATVSKFHDEAEWLSAARAQQLAILALAIRGDESLPLLDHLRRDGANSRQLPLLVIAAEGSELLAASALRSGAVDYLIHPVSASALLKSIAGFFALDPPPLKPGIPLVGNGAMVGSSAALHSIFGEIGYVASCESNVLITGETGTGKELVASLIHQNSNRSRKPLLCINCAAIPDALLESELFGYERGAFTGATHSYSGKLKAADGGAVFFDEIGDLSPFAQAKLLRLIETKEVQPLGGNKTTRVDIRILAATHRDLDTMATDDRFRRDLFFRLNVARIHIPPLRDRRPDIAAIAIHTVETLNQKLGADVTGFDFETLSHLMTYDWPGNVRELRNVIERIFIRRRSGLISIEDLPKQLRSQLASVVSLPDEEKARLLAALTATQWNKSKAAEKLHWSRMTIYRKMARYNMSAPKLAMSQKAS